MNSSLALLVLIAAANVQAVYWPERTFWERLWYGEPGCSSRRWRGWGGLTKPGFQQELDCAVNSTLGAIETVVDAVATEVADVVVHETQVVATDVSEIVGAAEEAAKKFEASVQDTFAFARKNNEYIGNETTVLDSVILSLYSHNSTEAERRDDLKKVLQFLEQHNETMVTEIKLLEHDIEVDERYGYEHVEDEINELTELKNAIAKKEVSLGSELADVASNATADITEMLKKDSNTLYRIFHSDGEGNGHIMAYVIVIGAAVAVFSLVGTFVNMCCICCKNKRRIGSDHYNEDFA